MRTIVFGLLLMTACTDDTVEPGLLGPYGGIVQALPSTTTGTPFVLHISTFGGGCQKFERTDVDLRADGADIWPMDRFSHSGDGCTHILNHYVHDVTLTFEQLGTKKLLVHGSQEVAGGGLAEYRVELDVVVGCPNATCASLDP